MAETILKLLLNFLCFPLMSIIWLSSGQYTVQPVVLVFIWVQWWLRFSSLSLYRRQFQISSAWVSHRWQMKISPWSRIRCSDEESSEFFSPSLMWTCQLDELCSIGFFNEWATCNCSYAWRSIHVKNKSLLPSNLWRRPPSPPLLSLGKRRICCRDVIVAIMQICIFPIHLGSLRTSRCWNGSFTNNSFQFSVVLL